MLAGVDPVAVDAAFGAWLARGDQAAAAVGEAESPTLPLVAADGKAVRGARVGEGEAPRLLAAAAPGGVVLAPAQVATKSNEIPGFATLLNTIDIAGKVVVADALRT